MATGPNNSVVSRQNSIWCDEDMSLGSDQFCMDFLREKGVFRMPRCIEKTAPRGAAKGLQSHISHGNSS